MVTKKQIPVGWEFMSGNENQKEELVRYIVNAMDDTISISQTLDGVTESVHLPIDEVADVLIRLIRSRYKIA